GAMARLAADAAAPRLEDVLGPTASVQAFVAASDGDWSLVMSQGIYECRAVSAPAAVPGTRRMAQPRDRALLADWVQRLSAEALAERLGDEDALARIGGHLARGTMHVWENADGAVSLAAAVAPTPNGIRINNVYTPPEHRRRGYASALVAALTQAVLHGGRTFAFLHTDLANPTSNGIYERIGYRRVAELQVLRRLAPAAGAPEVPSAG
ncbi:MAG TPA: GNAT family N-acetyltransferase, partial [Gemmatimonadaceae bacterium]|nr:GNAT family N-acetyltransferase [Gemmatimonadaceae bacterium]